MAHALLTNSGTQALHSMFVATELSPGDEVICPAYTFFATVSPLLFTGARPVFVDCGPDGNVDPAAVRSAINSRTKAIVVTHMWGVPCDMAPLVEIANAHELALLEDTSHAFGAAYKGAPVGSFGRAAAQSLQGQKPLTGGEGGVMFTSDPDVYYRALALGHYNKRCKSEIPADHWLSEFAVTGMGLKYRSHPLAMAIVEQQLDDYDNLLASRDRAAERMISALGALPGIEPVVPAPNATSSWYALVLRLTDDIPGRASIDTVYKALLAEGATEVDRPGSTCPLPQLPLFQNPSMIFPAYRGTRMQSAEAFPRANAFHESILKLPVWRAEEYEIIDEYIEAFQKVWKVLGDLDDL